MDWFQTAFCIQLEQPSQNQTGRLNIKTSDGLHTAGLRGGGQGKDNSRTFLRENPAIAAKLEAELREKFQPAEAQRDESADDDSDD